MAVPTSSIEALVFDVFGTVVDWRTSITAEVSAVARATGVRGDWPAFADEWRRGYHDGMKRVNAGEWPWTPVDVIHRKRLDELLPRYGLGGLDEAARADLNKAWHRLRPWPDAVEGLSRLKRRYLIAPLSNGNVRLLTDMAKAARLPWDLVLSAELAGRYKPDPAAYLRACELLAAVPASVMMVAAHSSDLRAAAATGLRTGFVHRPTEYGPTKPSDTAAEGEFDVVATDFLDLARKMDA